MAWISADSGSSRSLKRASAVLHALIVTLVYSRHQYVHVTTSQQICDLVEGLEDAWVFFGGVVVRVVLDNLRAAVTRPDRYDPLFQRTFKEYDVLVEDLDHLLGDPDVLALPLRNDLRVIPQYRLSTREPNFAEQNLAALLLSSPKSVFGWRSMIVLPGALHRRRTPLNRRSNERLLR